MVPLFWISDGVSFGFQSHNGLPHMCCGVKCNIYSLRPTYLTTLCEPLDGQQNGSAIQDNGLMLPPIGRTTLHYNISPQLSTYISEGKLAWHSGSMQHCCVHGQGSTPGQGLGSVLVGGYIGSLS